MLRKSKRLLNVSGLMVLSAAIIIPAAIAHAQDAEKSGVYDTRIRMAANISSSIPDSVSDYRFQQQPSDTVYVSNTVVDGENVDQIAEADTYRAFGPPLDLILTTKGIQK